MQPGNYARYPKDSWGEQFKDDNWYKQVQDGKVPGKSLKQKFADGKQKFADGAAKTPILNAALALIGSLELFNGFGNPDDGFDFTSGKMKFGEYYDALEQAKPESQYWDGDSADAYAAANLKLMELTQTMQDLDAAMQDLVEKQGQQVYEVRLVIAYTLAGLASCIPIAIRIYDTGPPHGPTLSYIFQTAAAWTAFGVAIAYETITAEESKTNAASAATLADSYDAVAAAAAQRPATLAGVEVPEGLKSTVSGVEAVSESTSDVAAMLDVAGVAGRGALADLGAFLTGDADTSGDDTPAPTPAFTLPSMSRIRQASEHVAETSGRLAEHMNLVNQTMGSVQQLASRAQPGPGAAVPAEEAPAEEAAPLEVPAEEATLAGRAPAQAVLAGDVEGAGSGAASGASDAGRAPIETVGPRQEPEPSPLERSV